MGNAGCPKGTSGGFVRAVLKEQKDNYLLPNCAGVIQRPIWLGDDIRPARADRWSARGRPIAWGRN